MAVDVLPNKLVEAPTSIQRDPQNAIPAFLHTLNSIQNANIDAIKAAEESILEIGEIYKTKQQPNELASLIRTAKQFFLTIPKAKTAKIIRTLVDLFSEIPGSLPLQVQICKELIDWAIQEKRTFLRQALETRMVALYLDNKMYSESLNLIGSLLKELKKLDDKNVLMEVHLLDSRVYHALRNVPKSRAALTSARTSANAIYCPPLMQAQLDMQSGILHAEDKDYKTAYSYFYETFESFSSQDDKRAVLALKYMLLCKIMLNLTDDVQGILNSKLPLRYSGPEVESMKAVAKAYQSRSLQEFERSLRDYQDELQNDPIIKTHLSALYDTLYQQNLLRVIEPFSRVEITHVAALVKLPTREVEFKLSQMILDKVLNGILDQGAGCLLIFEPPAADKTYEAALDTIKHMGHVVDALYEKASQLS
jgi:26S proteasome regulatory subunit N6